MGDMTIPTGAAAILLGVTPVSVSNFARTGVLRHFRKNNRLYFDIVDVLAFRSERATRPRIGRPTVLESIQKINNLRGLPSAGIAERPAGQSPAPRGTDRRRRLSPPTVSQRSESLRVSHTPSPVSILQHAKD